MSYQNADEKIPRRSAYNYQIWKYDQVWAFFLVVYLQLDDQSTAYKLCV